MQISIATSLNSKDSGASKTDSLRSSELRVFTDSAHNSIENSFSSIDIDVRENERKSMRKSAYSKCC